MEDAAIIELYWQRDESAVRETERRYGPYLTRIAANILSNPEDAQECVGDVYWKAWGSIPPQRPRNLPAYLATLTRQGAIDALRRRERHKRGGGQSPVANLEVYILPHWEDMAIVQQFPWLEWEDRDYSGHDAPLPAEKVGAALGTAELTGNDHYSEEEHRISAEFFAIEGISPQCAVAVRYDGQDKMSISVDVPLLPSGARERGESPCILPPVGLK